MNLFAGSLFKTQLRGLTISYHFRFLQSKAMTPFSSGSHLIPRRKMELWETQKLQIFIHSISRLLCFADWTDRVKNHMQQPALELIICSIANSGKLLSGCNTIAIMASAQLLQDLLESGDSSVTCCQQRTWLQPLPVADGHFSLSSQLLDLVASFTDFWAIWVWAKQCV